MVLKVNVVVSEGPQAATAILSIRDPEECRRDGLLVVPTMPHLGAGVSGPAGLRQSRSVMVVRRESGSVGC